MDLCLTFNTDQTACTSCPNRSYLVDGCCIQVNGYCSQWVATTGVCTACYVGYKINKNNNKECIRAWYDHSFITHCIFYNFHF